MKKYLVQLVKRVYFDIEVEAEDAEDAEAEAMVLTGYVYPSEVDNETLEVSEIEPCLYCGGGCDSPKATDACDGYSGDVDGLYAKEGREEWCKPNKEVNHE